MAVTEADLDPVPFPAPWWPAEPIDPTRAYVDYGAVADELVVYFGDGPAPSYSAPLDVPGFEDVAVMVDLRQDESSTGEVVGIHVMPLLAGAVRDHPGWAALAWVALAGEFGEAEEELRARAVAGLVAEVADAFAHHRSEVRE